MQAPVVKPIGPVTQNNAMPWLPPIKTLSNIGEDEETEHAARRPARAWDQAGSRGAGSPLLEGYGVAAPGALGLQQQALLAAQQQQVGGYGGMPFSQAGAEQAPNVAYLLQLLQHEREQLKTQAMQNELLLRTVLSTAAPAAGPMLMPGDGLWHPMGHGAGAMAAMPFPSGARPDMPPLQSSRDTSSVDNYASDSESSSTSSGKRKERESSADSESSMRKKRMYAKAACTACRVSHIACDDMQPCRNCVRSGSHCQRIDQVKVYVPPSFDAQGKMAPSAESSDAGAGIGQNARSIELALMGRKYVKAACMCCRRSHLACDNYRPCRNCVRMGVNCEEVRSQRRSVDCTKRRRGPQVDALKQLMAAA